MALISYKLNRIAKTRSATRAFFTLLTGEITTVTEQRVPTTEEELEGATDLIDVSTERYLGSTRVATGRLVRKGLLTDAELLPLLNAELAIRAADLGHTPIDEQTNE